MIYITDYIDNLDIEKQYKNKYELYSYKDKDVPYEKVKVLLVWHEKVDKILLTKFPNVQFIQRYGVGYDMVDLELLREKGILFANNPDYGVEEVALTALGLILDLSRNITYYNNTSRELILTSSESWQENTQKGTKRLSEQKLGIIGFGRIGQKLSQLSCKIFKGISIYDPYLKPGTEKIFNVEKVESLDRLAKSCDIISFNCPLNNETNGIISDEFIQSLDNKIIINTARGGLIQNVDHIHLGLQNGNIKAVGLDVLPEEPPKESSFIKSFNKNEFSDRVIINPHTAYYTDESYNEMRSNAIKNCIRYLNNENVYNLI